MAFAAARVRRDDYVGLIEMCVNRVLGRMGKQPISISLETNLFDHIDSLTLAFLGNELEQVLAVRIDWHLLSIVDIASVSWLARFLGETTLPTQEPV